ncbi:MAG: hypothetical protein GY884_13950 [Proteobacteria bacterium]|nr:hypothetical protein [Pseudomonadota bacterium]
MPSSTAVVALAAAIPQAVVVDVFKTHTDTSDIRELLWDGEVLWAATGGGLEAYDEQGRHLATVTIELPGTSLQSVGYLDGQLVVGTEERGAAGWDGDAWVPIHAGRDNLAGTVVAVTDRLVTRGDRAGLVSDAVSWNGVEVLGSLEGRLLVGDVELDLGCPIVDLAGGAEVRVACMFTSFTYDGELHEVGLPATAAHPEAWGLRSGQVVGDDGRIGGVPGRVTSLAALPGGWAVGTEDGLYLLDHRGQRRVTPEGQICGNFVTGVAEYEGEILVTTFQDGACRFDGHAWTRIEGLPGELANDVVVHDGLAYFGTSHGLGVWDGEEMALIDKTPTGRGKPGLQHDVVTALASGDRLWMSDLVGPVSVDDEGYWRRHRYSVFGMSYQAAAACGDEAWVGSEDAGVSHWTGRRWEHFDGSDGLPDDWVMAVACDGTYGYAGTYQDGTWRWDGRAWTQLDVPDGWTLSLAVADEGLYVGTLGGLFLVGDQTVELPAPDARVHQLTVSDSRVYVGTEGGLTVLARPQPPLR